MGNFWVSLWVDHPIVFGQKILYIVVLRSPTALYIVCFQATMQNYYFVDFYICRWYSKSARRTKHNKSNRIQKLEKAKFKYPFTLTWKSLFLYFAHCTLITEYPYTKRRLKLKKRYVKWACYAHMSIIISYLQLGGVNSNVPTWQTKSHTWGWSRAIRILYNSEASAICGKYL